MPKPPAASVKRLGARAVPEAHEWLAELLARQQEDFNGKLDQLFAQIEGLRVDTRGLRPTPPEANEGAETNGQQPEPELPAAGTVVLDGVDLLEDKDAPCARMTSMASRLSTASKASRAHGEMFGVDFEGLSQRRTLEVNKVAEDVCHTSPFLSWFMRKPLDIISAVMTIMNSTLLYMVLEYEGYKTRVGMGLEVDGRWRIMAGVMEVATLAFALLFLLEVVARLVYFGKPWLREALNVFDLVVVLLNVVDAFILRFVDVGSEDMVFVRLCLIVRLLRVVRLAHTVAAFHELRVILRTIVVSCAGLVWSMLVLSLMMVMSAMFLVSALSGFVRDEGNSLETRMWVEKHYGDATKATWTMFQITMSGGWPNWVVPLVEKVHPVYAIYFGFYIIVVVFATTRIIAALLLKHTLQVVEGEKDMMIQNQVKKKAAIAAKIENIFREADTSNDGMVSWEEFHALLSQHSVASYFSALELEVHELESIFTLMDDGDGFISCQEFLSGVMRLKGQARSLDVLTVLHYIKQVSEKVHSLYEAKYEDTMEYQVVAAKTSSRR